MWEEIVAKITEIANTPVVVAGVSLGTLGALTLVIISKSNFGKKTINAIKTRCELVESRFNETILGLNNLKTEISDQTNAYKDKVEKKVENIESKEKSLKTLVLAIAENSHNEKIKKALLEYKGENDENISSKEEK